MKERKDPKIFLEHILESINEIERNIDNMSEVKFSASTTIQDAIVRRLEIIGEATKNLPISFREKHTTIPWKKMAGMRDVLIHGYFGIDMELVWKITQKDIPELKKKILKLLENF